MVFLLVFVINWFWEILHSRLYLHYQGGPITLFILTRAALADAVIISALVFAAQKFSKNKSLFVIISGLILAGAIEIWALKTGRWAYNETMSVIPIVKTGLTPTIQLALAGYIAQKIFSIS